MPATKLISVSEEQAPKIGTEVLPYVQIMQFDFTSQAIKDGQQPIPIHACFGFTFFRFNEHGNRTYLAEEDPVDYRCQIENFFELARRKALEGDLDYIALNDALNTVFAKQIAEQKKQFSSTDYVEVILE